MFCAIATACAACIADTTVAEDDQDLEDLTPAALHWVSPLAEDIVRADEPVDISVYTQSPGNHVVHFSVDGTEVGICDPATVDQDCFDEDHWTHTEYFEAAGHHTLSASFTGGDGVVVSTTRDIDVQAASTAADPEDPSPDPEANDPASVQISEGPSQIVDAIRGARGYLDPDRPLRTEACHRAPSSRACTSPRANNSCRAWAVQNGRVVLQAPSRIDGSTSQADRCVRRYHDAIARYADLSSVSRASVAAWLAVSHSCEPLGAWSGRLVTPSQCAQITRTHAFRTAFGGHGLDPAACRDRMRASADFTIELAVAYLAGSVRQHHHNPPFIAAKIFGGRHHQTARANHWCVGSGRGSQNYIDSYVGAYNAYRTWENQAPPGTVREAARHTSLRVGAFAIGQPNCAAPANATEAADCAAILHFSRTASTASWWGNVQRACLPPGVAASGACAMLTPCAARAASDPLQAVDPSGQFEFARIDAEITWARVNAMTIQANTLLYAHLPPVIACELAAAPADQRAAILFRRTDAFLRAIFTRYGNEPLMETWSLNNETIGTRVYQVGATQLHLGERTEWRDALGDRYPEYLLHSYQLAHSIAPNAVLAINERSSEGMSDRAQYYRDLVAWLLSQGAPLHLVGLQGHLSADPSNTGYYSPDSIHENMDLISRTYLDPVTLQPWTHLDATVRAIGGPTIQLTELDVRVTGSNPEAQRRYYYDVAHTCASQPRCDGIMFWGIADSGSWANCFWTDRMRSALDASELFDLRFCPKPLLPAFVEGILSGGGGHPFPAATTPACATPGPALACVCIDGTGGGLPACCATTQTMVFGSACPMLGDWQPPYCCM